MDGVDLVSVSEVVLQPPLIQRPVALAEDGCGYCGEAGERGVVLICWGFYRGRKYRFKGGSDYLITKAAM